VRRALIVALGLSACAQAAPKPSAVATVAAPSVRAATPTHARCSHSAPATCDSAAPSFDADVRPVLEKRCFGCHTGDGAAAEEHDFSRMDHLLAARPTIVDEVATCSMPPKSPLEDAEANVILRWAGCPPRQR